MDTLSHVVWELGKALNDRDVARDMLIEAQQRVDKFEANPLLAKYVAALCGLRTDSPALEAPPARSPSAVSMRAYALSRGVSAARVGQLVADGTLTAPAVLTDGQIDPDAADEQLAAGLQRGKLRGAAQYAISMRQHGNGHLRHD